MPRQRAVLPPPPVVSPTGGRRRAVTPPYSVNPRPQIYTTIPAAAPTQATTRDPRTTTLNQSAMGQLIPWFMGPFITGIDIIYLNSFSDGTVTWIIGGICIGPIQSAQPFADKIAMRLVSGSALNPNGTLYQDASGNTSLWLFDGSQTTISVGGLIASDGLIAVDPLALSEEVHTNLALCVIKFLNLDGQQSLPTFEFHGEGYRLVFDPADSTQKYTENPSLQLREIITNVSQGMAFPLVDDSTSDGGFQMAEADCNDPVFILLPSVAPTITSGSGGSVDIGTYYYTWTAEDGNGIETGESPVSAPFTLFGVGSSTVTPGTGATGTAARNVYRSVINDPSAIRYRVGRINNNTVGASLHDTMNNATALVQGAAPVNSPHAERYRGGIGVAKDATAQSYLDTLRGQCMGALDMTAGKYQLRIDKPFPGGYVFPELRELPNGSTPPNLSRTTVQTYYTEQVDDFNVATVTYFDVNNNFTPASVTERRRNADGTYPPPKEAVYNFDGVPDRNVAQRLCTQIINTTHFLFEAQGDRSLLALQQGDGVHLIAAGVDDYFKLNAPTEINDQGIYIYGKKYDPATYSNVVVNEDSPINGTTTDASATPKDPTNINISSKYTSNFPGYGESIIIDFTPGISPFSPRTRCVVDDGLTVRALPEQQTGPFVISQPRRGATYTITLLTVTRFGKVSPGVTDTYVPTYLGPLVPDVLNLAAPYQTLEQRGTITFTGPDYPFTDHVDVYDVSFATPRKIVTALPSQFGAPIDCRAAIHEDGYTKPQTFQIEVFVVSSAGNATSPGVPISWNIPVTGIASYTVGNDPRDIIQDSSGFLWITCYAAGTIQQIDRVSGAVLATISVGSKPFGITYGSGSLWVTVGALGGTSAVKRVDPIGLTVTNTITLTSGSDPTGIIHDGTNVWVSSYSRNEVVCISPSSNTITATVSVGAHPCLLRSLGAYIYVTCFADNSVNVLNSSGVLAVIPVGSGPFGLTADTNGFLWCTNYAGSSISKIDPGSNTVILTLPLSSQGGPVDCCFGNGEVWVTEAITRQCLRINVNKNIVSAWVPLPSSPRSIIYDGHYFWTPNNLNAASALVPITAFNPTPGGGTSNPIQFQITGLDVGPLPS